VSSCTGGCFFVACISSFTHAAKSQFLLGIRDLVTIVRPAPSLGGVRAPSNTNSSHPFCYRPRTERTFEPCVLVPAFVLGGVGTSGLPTSFFFWLRLGSFSSKVSAVRPRSVLRLRFLGRDLVRLRDSPPFHGLRGLFLPRAPGPPGGPIHPHLNIPVVFFC